MKPSEVITALGKHLGGMPDCPKIVRPNRTQEPLPEKPYLTFQMGRRGYFDPTLDGSCGNSSGSLMIVVVWEKNAYTSKADDMAEDIRERFNKATQVGGVTISASSVLKGFATDTDWRVPVSIDWTT